MTAANPQRGYLLGLTAYIIWGLFPIYFKAIQAIPALEIIVHRALWSALFGAALLAVWKHPGWWRELRDNPARLLVLAGCGLLILGERLRRLQWLAVGLAALGVAQQVWQVGSLPWVSLVLALTFGFYGLIRKKAPVAALPGLVVETWLLLPIALAWLALHPAAMSNQAAFWSSWQWLLLAAAGPITLVPLVCFNAAARHLPYTTLGFLQYIAPTLVMLQAIFLFNEHFDPAKLMAFVCIWAGLVVYSLDIWLSLRGRKAA